MTKEQIINNVAQKLIEIDSRAEPCLINFVDDTVDWNAIAKVAVEVMLAQGGVLYTCNTEGCTVVH